MSLSEAIPAPTAARLYTQGVATQVAGCTYRELDYWIRRKGVPVAVPAAGSGSIRRFTLTQIALARLFAVLQANQVELGRRIAISRSLIREPKLWEHRVLLLADNSLVPAKGHREDGSEVTVAIDLPAIWRHVMEHIPADVA